MKKSLTAVLLSLTAIFLSYSPGRACEECGGKGAGASYSVEQMKSIAAQKGFGMTGDVRTDDFDPTTYLTSRNFNHLPPEERAKFYKETKMKNGSLVREYWFYAVNKEIEIAPGIFFPAWTYNGQVPGPTLRATEGDVIRIHFLNQGDRPHTLHFHGFHPEAMDGSMPHQFVQPGDSFLYEFKADPVGLHLYHCHSTPLMQHLAKGLYGVYLVDPKIPRPPAHELIMMMNGFDTNFDRENDVYAVNTVAFHYVNHPIQVKLGEPIRIYLVNITEFDPVNSFHVHAHFFYEYRTGTGAQPDGFTDTIVLGQAERSMLEMDFRYTGMYMFHAHVTEFAEQGWMGLFEVLP
ncbi:MAG: multicopper oxidase domain-containing protein [candidate division Zixibacteria bacterium]|nr:multicopper oxidase domain-containing protein [candidate division Zixibacteria bacterium]